MIENNFFLQKNTINLRIWCINTIKFKDLPYIIPRKTNNAISSFSPSNLMPSSPSSFKLACNPSINLNGSRNSPSLHFSLQLNHKTHFSRNSTFSKFIR